MNNYKTHGVFSIEQVREFVGEKLFLQKRQDKTLEGKTVKCNSQRYQVFFGKGCQCVSCGLNATYFKLQTDVGNEKISPNRSHFNLYGIKDGKEILFTKDHIVPRSKGGRNSYKNYQTMCVECNQRKGETYGI